MRDLWDGSAIHFVCYNEIFINYKLITRERKYRHICEILSIAALEVINGNVISKKFSILVAQVAIILTTSCTTSEENFVNMTFSFQLVLVTIIKSFTVTEKHCGVTIATVDAKKRRK